MSETTIFWIIWAVTYLVTIGFLIYMIFKMYDIVENLEDRFTYFNEELIILSDVLKKYQERIDNEDIPSIPLPFNKNVSGW